MKNGGCEQICHNKQGSYHCSCHTGYALQRDNKTCEGKANVILSFSCALWTMIYMLLRSHSADQQKVTVQTLLEQTKAAW